MPKPVIIILGHVFIILFLIIFNVIMPIHENNQYTYVDAATQKPNRQNSITAPGNPETSKKDCTKGNEQVNYSLRDCHISTVEIFIFILVGSFQSFVWWLILYQPNESVSSRADSEKETE